MAKPEPTDPPVLEAATTLHMLGWPILLTDEFKSPGFVGGDWGNFEWTIEKLAHWFKKKKRCQLGIKLWPLVDIEIDAPPEDDGAYLAAARAEFAELVGDTKTVSWTSKRGQHWLFKANDEQRAILETLGCTSVVKLGKLEIRLGCGKSAQSLIPPSTTEGVTREWVVPLGADEPETLPTAIFDRVKAHAEQRVADREELDQGGMDRPGDIYNRKTTWDELLTPLGWKPIGSRDGQVRYWTRPGKARGAVSATTGYCKSTLRDDQFYCFSTSPDIEPIEANRGYSKFELYTALEFDGDYGAASSELAAQGFTVEAAADGSEFGSVEEDDEEEISIAESEQLPEFVFDNPIGKYCLQNDAYTEANIESVFLQSMEIFGNWIGRDVSYRINNSMIRANGFLVVVGTTARGRKGTAFKDAMAPYNLEDVHVADYRANMVGTGIASGEAVVARVADAGASGDGRFLAHYPEIHAMLAALHRENSSLGSMLREAYDGNPISVLTKKDPLVASRPHVSLLMHTTEADIRGVLSSQAARNGLLNRMLFFKAANGKLLPRPGVLDEGRIRELLDELILCREWAIDREITWSAEAEEAWDAVYLKYNTSRGDELLDSMFQRATDYIIKYCLRFAILARSGTISLSHLHAALAIVERCISDTIDILGRQSKEFDDKDKILQLIKDSTSITRSDISRLLFHNKHPMQDIKDQLRSLETTGKIKSQKTKKGRRTFETWVPTNQE